MDDDFFYDELKMFDYWQDKANNDLAWQHIIKIEEDELTKFSSEPRIKIYTRR